MKKKMVQLPKEHIFQQWLDIYAESRLCEQNNQHYEVLPYHLEHRKYYHLYVGASLLGHALSAGLAATFVYFQVLPLCSQVQPYHEYAAFGLTLLLLGLIEGLLYLWMGDAWKIYFQFGTKGTHRIRLRRLSIAIVLMSLISIFTSLLGGWTLPTNTTTKPTYQQPSPILPQGLTQLDSLRQGYQSRLQDHQKQLESFWQEHKYWSKSSQRWKLKADKERLYNDLQQKWNTLQANFEPTIQQAMAHNQQLTHRADSLQKNQEQQAQTAYETALSEYQTDTQTDGNYLALLSLFAVGATLFTSYKKEEYRYKSHQQFTEVAYPTSLTISEAKEAETVTDTPSNTSTTTRNPIGFHTQNNVPQSVTQGHTASNTSTQVIVPQQDTNVTQNPTNEETGATTITKIVLVPHDIQRLKDNIREYYHRTFPKEKFDKRDRRGSKQAHIQERNKQKVTTWVAELKALGWECIFNEEDASVEFRQANQTSF